MLGVRFVFEFGTIVYGIAVELFSVAMGINVVAH